MNPTLSLDIRKIEGGYGGSPVITDITFDVQMGETYGLIGLNGAGKTTLLKMILGLKTPMSGEIFVSGFEAGSAGAQKHIAYLPERFDPAWFLNAYEFIEFTLSLYGRSIKRSDIDTMAERLGLKVSFLPKRAQTYSKGMRQKLGLMATFLTKCPLIILDEPMSGLDPLARAQVKDLILSAKAEGTTVFMSSHILSDMEELCNRVSVMHKGTLRFIGNPLDLLAMNQTKTLERAFLNLIHGDDSNLMAGQENAA